MFELRFARLRRPARVLVHATVAGITLAVTACASDEEYRREAYGDQYASVDPRGRYGNVRPQTGPDGQPLQRKADVEDDGLPPQTPPLKSRRRETDDPREPFSPNYGKPAGAPPPAAVPDQPPRQVMAPSQSPAVASWSYRLPR